MKVKQNWLLAGILILATGLRLVMITQSPPSLYWEEAALGYDAYSILKTGKDYHGNPWPIVAFESFGDWKPSGYFYVLVPFIAIFGLSEMAIRLPSAIAGVATVGLVYLIVLLLSKNKRWALWSGFILAILPWHIQFSRAAFEVNLATFWLTLGVYSFLRGMKTSWWYLVSSLSIGISIYTYHGLRVLGPLMVGLLFLWYRKSIFRQKLWWVSLSLGILIVTPLLKSWNDLQVQQRINETSLFSTSKAVKDTNAWREADGNTFISRAIHHRYWYWGREIAAGMASHFNPNFLFLTGDDNQRHQTGIHALLFPWMIIPLVIAGMKLVTNKKKDVGWLVGWIVLATIPVALTNLTPHTLRFLPGIPAVAMVIGWGMDYWWQGLKTRQLLRSLTVGIIGICLSIYIFDLWWIYPKRASQNWQYGYKQVAQIIKPLVDQGKTVKMTNAYGRASIYMLLYLKIDPRLIQSQVSTLPKDQAELLAFGPFDFRNKPRDADIVVTNQPMNGYALINTVPFLDKNTAFYVYQTE